MGSEMCIRDSHNDDFAEHWTEKDGGADQADFQDPESIRLRDNESNSKPDLSNLEKAFAFQIMDRQEIDELLLQH